MGNVEEDKKKSWVKEGNGPRGRGAVSFAPGFLY